EFIRFYAAFDRNPDRSFFLSKAKHVHNGIELEDERFGLRDVGVQVFDTTVGVFNAQRESPRSYPVQDRRRGAIVPIKFIGTHPARYGDINRAAVVAMTEQI